MRTLLRKIKLRKFKKVFGFVPSEGRIRTVEQMMADERLRGLAEESHSFCSQEDARYAAVLDEFDEEDLYSVHIEILALHYNLEAAKKAFWRAHELAKEVGFNVKNLYTDYLPEGLDRYR